MNLVFCCAPENDLWNLLPETPRFESLEEALPAVPEGGGVLVLADDYPGRGTVLGEDALRECRAKGVRLYLEYPERVPGLALGPPVSTEWERAVVASERFGPGLERLRILAIHGCRHAPAQADRADIVMGRVAGFDSAVYGLPEPCDPILFTLPDEQVLIATTKLSGFVTGRFAPTDAWKTIWEVILSWLDPRGPAQVLKWTPKVRPRFSEGAPLPVDVEKEAVRRGVGWYLRSGLLVHSSWDEALRACAREDRSEGPPLGKEIGDGRFGILEGFASAIQHDGSQPQRYVLRCDCITESAMGLAFGGEDERRVAGNLIDFVFTNEAAVGGVRSDPSHPAYGLIAWGVTNTDWCITSYGDDNARDLLAINAAAALTGNDRWDSAVAKALWANLRTSGRLGFRRHRIDLSTLTENGWRHYYEEDFTLFSPHYEAYLWAVFLWAYGQTGYPLLLERAKTAIRMTMDAYPDQWRWTNGIAQERARMLLPLAWLVRVDDTPEHRKWLDRMASDVLRTQASCGALREELGLPEMGKYAVPTSNEAYGKREAPLLQENGDPLCDMLYTTNFAFLGLHEAAAAIGDARYAEAADRLAAFLCRIQTVSGRHPELDGAWFRAFDFRRWEYWASNADFGWGAWSIESGWSQAWILAVLAMRTMRTSLWELTARSTVAGHFRQMQPVFLPDTI